MNRTKIFSLFLLLATSICVHAQEEKATAKAFNQISYLSWDVNIPVNNSFVSKTSFAGGTLGFRKMLHSGNISVGADVSWSSYYEFSPQQTYQLKDGAVTTDLYKYVYTLPVALTAHYYFNAGQKIHPYAGLGIGGTYGDERLYFNTYVAEDDQWGFLVRPEVGVLVKPDPESTLSILFGVKYNYSTNKYSDFKIDNLQSLGLQLGLVWGW